jgi:hypothetical protein
MKRQFKDEDIIRFIYEEMNPKESDVFLTELCSDESLWERYEQFQTLNEKVANAVIEPSDEACEKVMAFVKETASLQKQIPQKTPNPIQSFLAGKIPVAISLNAIIVVALILFVSVAILGSAYELTRGTIIRPNGALVQQVEMEDDLDYNWDDSEINEKLKMIRKGVETIQEDPIL